MHAGSRYNGFGSPGIQPERVDLTLVVPAYNEADRLEEGLDRLATILAGGAADPTTTEVLVVDDGSSDETATRAEKLIVRFRQGRVIRLPSNAGKGAAVRGGVAAAAGPRVAFMDADMSIDPAQLPALLAALNTAPVAIGSRASSTGAVDYDNLVRTTLGRGFNRLVNAVTGVGLADTQCGFKAFRTPVARLLFHLTVIDRFAFDVEVLFRARRLGLEIAEVPVQWRHVAESRVRPLHDPLTMLGDVLRSRLGLPRPLPVQAVRLHPGRPGADLAGQARAIVGPLLPLVEESGGSAARPVRPHPTGRRCRRRRRPEQLPGRPAHRTAGRDLVRPRAVGPRRRARRRSPTDRGRRWPRPRRHRGGGLGRGARHPGDRLIVGHYDGPTMAFTPPPRTTSGAVVPIRLPSTRLDVPEEVRLSDVDEWGRSEHMRSIIRTLYEPVYSKWFRAEWEGLEKIPSTGGALIVANHAGAIPSDAPVIMHGIEKELGRPVYGLADYFFRSLPVLGTLWARGGGLPAQPANAYRLLREQGQLALVFPEGTKGPSKSFNDRYRLRRFGRGGFVEIAMRAGVPVVPIAVVGSEETMPVLARLPAVARAFRLPYFPVTLNMLVLGPLGIAVPFPAKFKLKVLDPVRFDVPPDQERYVRSRLIDEAERIRGTLQETLLEMLSQRRSVWFG